MDVLPNWGLGMMFLLGILAVWSAVWKGIALWKAGRNNDSGWYIAMFIVNTAGILEIIYIFAISKKKQVA